MKKHSCDNTPALASARRKRSWRRLKESWKRSSRRGSRPYADKLKKLRRRSKSRRGNSPPLNAPTIIDIYQPQRRIKFLRFIDTLKNQARSRRKIFISFKNSTAITAAAGLLLVAETDKLMRARPGLQIKCSFPPVVTRGKHKNSYCLVESALKQIGFFDLIGQASSKPTNQPNVRCWLLQSGDTAKGKLAGSLLQTIKDRVPEHAWEKMYKRMYRGSIEAIANCVEHAYPETGDDENIDRRWWMLVGIDDQDISVIVCDLGVGIPNTLPKRHKTNVLKQIFDYTGITEPKDAELIEASTYIKRSRTGLLYRGKGARDVRSVVKEFPTARLILRSNRGEYCLIGKDHNKKSKAFKLVDGQDGLPEGKLNHRSSIGGTMVEWLLTAEDLMK